MKSSMIDLPIDGLIDWLICFAWSYGLLTFLFIAESVRHQARGNPAVMTIFVRLLAGLGQLMEGRLGSDRSYVFYALKAGSLQVDSWCCEAGVAVGAVGGSGPSVYDGLENPCWSEGLSQWTSNRTIRFGGCDYQFTVTVNTEKQELGYNIWWSENYQILSLAYNIKCCR